ncbi:MAG: cation diffusion facilitator family transporter [Clostridiales bacterium GWB2_37_7]|nr:MAG: cation diffusion facilitator family transporter [Clostridiales bacterium GWB2_37_7]
MITNFLIKRFIKNYESTGDSNVRQAYGYLGGFVGVIANILLFAGKLSIGFLINSIAVMADAINNLSDAASSVITLASFKMTNKPADREHPFGHGRIEYISAMVVSFLVILVGFEFIKSSVERVMNPETVSFDWITFMLLSASIILKVWLSFFNRKLGRAIGSKAMEATAMDSLSDVITTSVVLLSLILSIWITFPIDGYIGIAVALFIMYSGFNLTKETLNPLLGEAPEAEFVNDIIMKTLSYEGVIGVHDIIIHNYGPTRCVVSLHAEIPASMDITSAHDLIDLAEQEISKDLGIHLVMHMDPINIDDKVVQKVQQQIVGVLMECGLELSIHDLRIVGDDSHCNVIFDMVIPHEVPECDEKKVAKEVVEAIKNKHPQFNPIITIDRSYAILK